MTDSLSLAGYSVDFLHVYIGIYKKNSSAPLSPTNSDAHVMKAPEKWDGENND